MCDYSLHALATRPAKVGDILVTTTFRGTSTRGFAAVGEPDVAVCLCAGTELGFTRNVKYYRTWFWRTTSNYHVAKFGMTEPNLPYRHHDTLEFPDGRSILVTMLAEGQRATVLQLPVTASTDPHRTSASRTTAATDASSPAPVA